MASWLVKSEPSVYSILDLERDVSTAWEGVRNYQARNNLRSMRRGEKVLFYHSVDDPIGIVGIAKVLKEAYPEALQFNKKSKYFDASASKENPRWFCPDLAFVEKFENILPLKQLKNEKTLSGMALLQKGSRLSVQPVSPEHFKLILALAQT